METQAVNSVTSSNPKYKKTAKIAGVSAAVGGGLSAISNYAGQKFILNNADLYKDAFSASNQKQTEELIKEVYGNSKGMQEKALKSIKQSGDYIKTLLERGKVSGGEVFKNTLKGAAKWGAVIGGVYFVGKTIKDFVNKD